MGGFYAALPDVAENAIADGNPLSTQFGADLDAVPFDVLYGQVGYQGAFSFTYADSLAVSRLGKIENDSTAIP